MLPVLYKRHSVHQFTHGDLVIIIYHLIGSNTRALADGFDVLLRVVLAGWCPRRNDRGNCVVTIPSDIPTEDHERGTHAVFHGNELFKGLIGGVGTFTQPGVSNSDIKRVVVANPAGFLFLHIIEDIHLFQ